MKMIRRSLLLAGLASALFLGSAATPSQAATLVLSDAGTIASFKLSNLGGGNFTLALSAPQTLTNINGTQVSIPAAFDAVLAFTVTATVGNQYAIESGTFTKTFGDPPDIASLTYNLLAGQSGTGFLKDGLILAGAVTSVSPNALPDYDFSAFGLGGAIHTFVFAATSYGGGVSSMAGVFATAGASATGSGGWSESAIPEPASMALLGIGLCGLFSYRRFLRLLPGA